MPAARRSTHGAIRRWAISVLLAIATVSGVSLAVDRYDLLHITEAPFDQIEVSRFTLGKWPTSWKEVKKASYAYYGSDTVGKEHFERVEITPMREDTCTVIFTLRNLLGFRYEEKRKLIWTTALAKRLANNEGHTRVASAIVKSYEEWVRDQNHGRVTKDMSGISAEIRSWDGSPHEVRRVELVQDCRSQGRISPDQVRFVVYFADGAIRYIVLP